MKKKYLVEFEDGVRMYAYEQELSEVVETNIELKMLKEYGKKYGIPEIINDMDECRKTTKMRIIFPNGWSASIVIEHNKNQKYSVAACDYNGYFDWKILNKFGATDGIFKCNTELDIIIACETIRRLPDKLIDD